MIRNDPSIEVFLPRARPGPTPTARCAWCGAALTSGNSTPTASASWDAGVSPGRDRRSVLRGATVKLLQMYRDAGVTAEAHIFQKGGHGFNMGQRSSLASVHTWPQRLADWLKDSGITAPAP